MSTSHSTDQDGETTTTITATTHLTLPAHPHKPSYSEMNPPSHPDEFAGVLGTTVMSFLCPFFAYFLFFGCTPAGCPPFDLTGWAGIVGRLSGSVWWDWEATWGYVAWYSFCVACWFVLPGERVEGGLLRDGTRNLYRMNGFYTLLLSLGITCGILVQPGGIERYTWLYDKFLPLMSASLAMSAFQAVFVYIRSFYSGELLALGGNSGRFFYDWFLGRPLNPTPPGFPGFDIKTFNEVRPGIILWMLLNISCACEQYIRIGRTTNSMWCVLAFEGYYAIDALWQESAILNQMDITTDGFGFMLSFGDLTWVPFTYGLQARYLAFHPVDLSPVSIAAILAIESAGVYIFRESNMEKGEFRKGRNPKNLTSLQTERGTKLLTSGWWGLSRHPNYFGDWLMAAAWCLSTGFSGPMTYYYLIFFVILLLHRQVRDDDACKKKYGKDWDKYCEIVPWKIIPYVY